MATATLPECTEAPIGSGTVNDLAIRVGTVNGSGSQSANLVLVRALFGMGVPCAAKNVFPSNIEGLPTWFHIRASAQGYIGHHPDPQVLVCMNAATAADDLRRLRSGGICLYRDDFDHMGKEDKELGDRFAEIKAARSQEVQIIPVPFSRLVKEAYPQDPKDKGYNDKLRKVINMVYVGVVAHAVGIEMSEIHRAIQRQFPGRKAKAGQININAADAGKAWAEANLPPNLPYRVQRLDATGGKVLVEGNQAAAMGAVFGGANVLTWYPITPSSSLAEYAEDYLKEHRVGPDGKHTFAVVQAEDELAAIGMAIGAGWAGARAITGTSGPGISLMSEFVGLGYFAEIPVVIVNVQRMGPSTGLPTRTSQGDIVKMHLLGHGDCAHPVLIPASPAECFLMTAEALNLAAHLQTPVFVALDLDLGMNLWMSERFTYPSRPLRRGKVLSAADLERLGGFARYKDVDGDGICYRTLPGTEHPKAAYFTRGTGHNEQSGYSERPEDWKRNMDRLKSKFTTACDLMPKPVIEHAPSAKVGLIAFGSSHWSTLEARDLLNEGGLATGYCRLRALPIAEEVERGFIAQYDRVYVIEQNRDGQVYRLLRSQIDSRLVDRLVSVTHYNGTPLAATDIVNPILEWQSYYSERTSRPEADGNGDRIEAPSGPIVSTE